MTDKVADDEKVGAVMGTVDDAEFIIHTLNEFFLKIGEIFGIGVKAVTFGNISDTDIAQELFAGDGAVGKFVLRIVVDFGNIFEVKAALFGDYQSIAQ